MNHTKKYALNEIPHYKVHGRTIPGVCPLPLFFNGSAVELNVSGSELWADLEVNWHTLDMWVTVEINGALISRQMLMPGVQSLCLFRGMSGETVKNVRITRETQAMIEDEDCCLIVHGFQADGIFHPVPKGKYTLEFVGDSITSGEGTYGAIGDLDWLPMYMSYSRDYAKMTAEALGADVYMISKGGWGVLSSWDNDPACNIPSRYEQLCGLCSGTKTRVSALLRPTIFRPENRRGDCKPRHKRRFRFPAARVAQSRHGTDIQATPESGRHFRGRGFSPVRGRRRFLLIYAAQA